jgi:heme-degrading monooxygenase HmoA
MITVANRMFVKPEYAEALEELFRWEDFVGFKTALVLRPCREDDPYVVLTFWESRAHFKDWLNSDAFQEGHARLAAWPSLKEAFRQVNHLEIHQVFLDSRRPGLVDEREDEALPAHG